MTSIREYFLLLLAAAKKSHHRYAFVINGDDKWQQQCIGTACDLLSNRDIVFLGGENHNQVGKKVAFNQGQRLLGQECQLLCCDFQDGFDANSFSAATGCVRGGGLVIILAQRQNSSDYAQAWLSRALQNLLWIDQYCPLPSFAQGEVPFLPSFTQQNQAIEKIIKVVEGHRKRPLVMTADRGRGKSSALGIAAAQLMQSRTIHIVVTAPSLATVVPLFEHAERLLPDAQVEKGRIYYQQSLLEFIAPDELLRSQIKSGCLFVDEASAIPIPMLQKMVVTHHRAVFSSTIHGYEGCGRGFTLKFQTWLKQQRSSTQFFHLDQPIRWSKNDPLEQWLFDTFLLNVDLPKITVSQPIGRLTAIKKQDLLAKPNILRACFALLVNAHYQTTPNDLMLLLSDDAIQLHAILHNEVCLGCILTVEEGQLDHSLIDAVLQGKRRPKGHLVATTVATQLGITSALEQSGLRIMRIALHPALQRQHIGSAMVKQLIESNQHDYYSTCFGATSELVNFWRYCGFHPALLGSQRDQASGTHSLIMLVEANAWQAQVEQHYLTTIQYALGERFNQIEIELVRSLLKYNNASVDFSHLSSAILNYCQGGANYDNTVALLDLWWKSYPSIVASAPDLFIRKIIQRWSWSACCEVFNYAGRKQLEQELKQQLVTMLSP